MPRLITNRCKTSLTAGVSIRFQKTMFDDKPRWRLMYPYEDIDYMTTYLTNVCEIKYCPFCGQKLEEPTDSLA